MKRFNAYILVAAIAVSGAGFSFAADNTYPNNNSQNQQIGSQQADQAVQKDARKSLANIVNDVLTPNKFDNLNGYIAKSDRDRLGEMKTMKTDDLNAAIQQFRADFKNKYNQEFDIQPEHLSNALVFAGQDKDSATVSLTNPDLNNASGLNDSKFNSQPTPSYTTGSTNNGSTNAPQGLNTPPSDRNLATNDTTVSNRSGTLSGAANDSSTSGKATGPASNGQNANSTVHGNDTMANPGVRSGNDLAANNTGTGSTAIGGNSNTSSSADRPEPGMTNAAPADRTLATNDTTVSNRDGTLSGAAADSRTSGKATGPASNGQNANSTVHGNDTMANPGIRSGNDLAAGSSVTSPPPAATGIDSRTNINNSTSTSINSALASSATLNLVNEGHVMNAWRLDLPNQISAEQLKQNLIKHIQMLDDQKATWPSDVNAAYRQAAFHVLQAFNDSSLATER